MDRAKCPKCAIDMDIVSSDGVEVDQCPRCGGIWVDTAEEKQALEMTPQVFTVDELRRLRTAYKPVEWKTEDVRYYKCPRCENLMWRRNYLEHSGIIVDKCRDHGTFFDKGEIEKAIEFVKKGGIEYEKLKIAEKGISEANIRIDRLSDKVERISYKLPWWARMLLYLGF